MDSKKLSKIDLVRLLAAMCIIVNHCFRESYGFMNMYGAEYVSRWTVGFFFIVSGFFLKDDFNAVLKYVIRIFVLYFIWTVVYALILGINIWNIRDMISNLRSGIIMPFWYFPSLIMCVLFVFLLNKIIKRPAYVVIVCAFLYIIAIAGDTLLNVSPVRQFMDTYFFPYFEKIMGVHDTRDGIFNGSLFISIGMYLKSCAVKGKLEIKNKKTFGMLFLVVLLIYLSEVTLNVMLNCGNRDVLISTPVLCTLIFVMAFNSRMSAEKSLLMRGLSSTMYVIHYLFLTIIQRYINIQIVWLAVVLMCSLLFGYVLIQMSRKIKPLQYLY